MSGIAEPTSPNIVVCLSHIAGSEALAIVIATAPD